MLKLLHTEGCHLCELALALIEQAQADGIVEDFERVDIALDDEMIERYGVRIPVVCCNNAELGWPFDYNGLQTFIFTHQH